MRRSTLDQIPLDAVENVRRKNIQKKDEPDRSFEERKS
jgi:hypothetical protein